MNNINDQKVKNGQRGSGKSGFSFLTLCFSLMSIVLLALLMTSCSADEDTAVTNRDMTKNADGSITIHRISSVALPGGFTATTRAATRAGETTEAVDEKTSWAEGDRLHITLTIKSTTDIDTYRYATMQSDGSWLLNGDVTIPANGSCTICFFYLGKKYNSVDFNDPTQNPDNIERDINATAWAEGKAASRVSGVYMAQMFKTADATTGITTYSDILAAQGQCTDGTWDTTDTNNTITINPTDGVFSITMRHLSNRVGITACDLSALGSGASVASIKAKLVTNKYGTPADYATVSLFPASSAVAGTQPSETTPWKAQLYNTYTLYLQSFVVTLTDGRKISVSVPCANETFDDSGRQMAQLGGEAYVYRLTLSPGSCTATPDANFTAPGWQTGETDVPTPIYNRADLEKIALNLGGNYILMNDIDLSGNNWTPLGKDYATAFTGKLNGNGHKIIGMTAVSTADRINIGLFGCTNRAIIYNLHFSNCTLQLDFGGTAGTLAASVYYGCVSNCSVTGGSIICTDQTSTSSCMGGLIGFQGNAGLNESAGTVIHCRVSNCHIESSTQIPKIGGLIGVASISSRAVACYTNGCTLKIPATVSEDGAVGGLLGILEGGTVLGCYAGNVCTTGNAQSNGALVGLVSENFTTVGNLASCYATNAVGSEATTAIAKGVLPRYSYVPLGATDYSSLVAAPATSYSDINTAVLSSAGSLSIVNRTWKATGIWGESEGAIVSQRPIIMWNYCGE